MDDNISSMGTTSPSEVMPGAMLREERIATWISLMRTLFRLRIFLEIQNL